MRSNIRDTQVRASMTSGHPDAWRALRHPTNHLAHRPETGAHVQCIGKRRHVLCSWLDTQVGEEGGGGGVGGVLGDEAAGDGGGEDGVTHALEALADGAESGFAGVELGERFLDRGHDPLLLGQRWNCQAYRLEVRSPKPRERSGAIVLCELSESELVFDEVATQSRRHLDEEGGIRGPATVWKSLHRTRCPFTADDDGLACRQALSRRTAIAPPLPT